MNTETKLLELCDGINFRMINSETSVIESREIIRYNEEQLARMEAMGEQHQERIFDMISLILAEKLYPSIMNQYGDTSDFTLRRFLNEHFYTLGIKSEWGVCKQKALKLLNDDGLDAKQIEIISSLIDRLPDVLIDILVHSAGRLKIVPIQEIGSVANTLIQMMKEGGNVNDTRNN